MGTARQVGGGAPAGAPGDESAGAGGVAAREGPTLPGAPSSAPTTSALSPARALVFVRPSYSLASFTISSSVFSTSVATLSIPASGNMESMAVGRMVVMCVTPFSW